MEITVFFKDGSVVSLKDVTSLDYGRYENDLYIHRCNEQEKPLITVIAEKEYKNIKKVVVLQEIFFNEIKD